MASSQNIHDLFADAVDDGLDVNASQIMVANLDAVALAGCQGTEVDLIPTDEVTLVSFIHDGSGSMVDERDVVVEAYRQVIEALQGSKQSDSILVSDWIFNDTRNLVHGFVPASQVPDLNASYNPDGSTALYDTVMVALTGLTAYGQQLRANGVRTKNVVVVFSDGDDNASRLTTAAQVKLVAQSLLAQETFILAYVGFDRYGYLSETGVRRLADSIGFVDVITATTDQSAIRKILRQVSASVIRASQTSVSSGGFFTGP